MHFWEYACQNPHHLPPAFLLAAFITRFFAVISSTAEQNLEFRDILYRMRGSTCLLFWGTIIFGLLEFIDGDKVFKVVMFFVSLSLLMIISELCVYRRQTIILGFFLAVIILLICYVKFLSLELDIIRADVMEMKDISVSHSQDGSVETAVYHVLRYPNGDIYEGELNGTVRMGKGTLRYAPGEGVEMYDYQGQWKDGKMHGTGVLRSVNGEVYNGEFQDGVKHGFGVLTYEKGVYAGDFENNTMNGSGVMKYLNGDIYSGNYVDGIPWGIGICSFHSGDTFEGIFFDGLEANRIMCDEAYYLFNLLVQDKISINGGVLTASAIQDLESAIDTVKKTC